MRLGLIASAFLLSLSSAFAQTADQIHVRDAWVREAAAGDGATAAYFVIENSSSQPASLIAVNTKAAQVIELHEMKMVMKGGPDHAAASGGMNEMMTMAKVDAINVPARGQVELKPGGLHVMLFKVASNLPVGASTELTLRFKNGVTKTVQAAVRSRTAAGR
ncbi:MAG: copper chaperone PCu(A)C [Vicinamibacterales bacterium]